MESPVLLVPGIGNSGAQHWQSRWRQNHAGLSCIVVDNWDQPDCQHWVAAIERAVQACGAHTRIAAHSLGCLAVAHWAASAGRSPIAGALLVAVPDPAGPAFPAQAHGFTPLPQRRFSFPSLIVASDNDPYAGMAHTERCAQAWGSRLQRVGKLGHINADSGLGDWEQGWALLAGMAPE